MSVDVIGFTEAKIQGKWECIDFYLPDKDGTMHLVPCIRGGSSTHYTLRTDCDLWRLREPLDLSEPVRKNMTNEDGNIYGLMGNGYTAWHVIEGSWFANVDLQQPEYCGFFKRQDVTRYLSRIDEYDLDENEMLSIDDYHELPDDEKIAYQYMEYTPYYGNRWILRDLKNSVMSRLNAYNSVIAIEDGLKELEFADCRVVLYFG